MKSLTFLIYWLVDNIKGVALSNAKPKEILSMIK